MHYYKRIYDSVHGFIYFSSLEKDLIDSYAFQRLHYLRQVGVAYLVYPGATHSRFQHSLGVMHIATQIFDQMMRNYEQPLEPSFHTYFRQIIRFASLCHDLGHLPFSHTAEEIVLGEGGHEKWTLDLIESSLLRPIWDRFRLDFPDKNVVEDIVKMSLGEEKLSSIRKEKVLFTQWEHVLSQVITGDFFGADRIDYLLRDARCTGVSYGLFDYQQLIETLRILPFNSKLTLGNEENGMESCEALLLARHFMHRRVYQYPSVKAYSFHMARFIKYLYKQEKPLVSLEKYLSYTDNEILSHLRIAFSDPSHPVHEDALALFGKEQRYLAFDVVGTLDLKDVEAWKGRFQVQEEELKIFVVEKKQASLFSFPVLSRNQKIIDSKSCFSISIPSHSTSWIYVSPKYKDSIKDLLDKYPLEKNESLNNAKN